MFLKFKIFLKIQLLLSAIIIVRIKAVPVKNVNIIAAAYEAEFYQEYVQYFSSKQISSPFRKLLDILSPTEPKILLDDVPSAIDTNICLKCRAASNVIVNEFKNRTNLDKVEQVLFSLCDLLTELSDTVCRGYANIFTPSVTYILKERKGDLWSTDEICGTLYQQYQCGAFDYSYKFNIQAGDPVLQDSKKSAISTVENITIVHLTDFHYDSLYSEGSSSICTDEICCRNTSMHLDSANKQLAGKWGDYQMNCDSPGYLVENICNQVYAQHSKIDLIYYTGDFVDHIQWTRTEDSVKDAIKFVTDTCKNIFGSIPIIPVLGNHDTHPSNLFAPNSVTDSTASTKWLYDFVVDQWRNWLPEHALNSLREGGYYTFIFRRNFRIIALNNNVCYTKNIWILHERDSLKAQLQWLYETLKEAEMNSEKVHIVGHIPPNFDGCYKPWVTEYISIVNRFAHIISGQFYGHSHLDEFSIFYTPESPSKALNVAWVGGASGNAFGLNSNYRVYYVDGESYEVLDHETWIFNVTEANQSPDNPPKWFKEYSFKEFYEVPDLSPVSLSDMLADKWMKEASLMTRFWQNKVKHSDVHLD
ncbi:hypothetical protein HA402_004553 [Bradysia odoriphaga]|nr:hypothetical protein HA402_004553 [Bradysia odoriphaga]